MSSQQRCAMWMNCMTSSWWWQMFLLWCSISFRQQAASTSNLNQFASLKAWSCPFSWLSLTIFNCLFVFLHCAKSHRPFELFANENYKLQNEAKMNVMFERGSARDASAVLSLLRWTMLLCEESACQLHGVLSTWEWLRHNDGSCCSILNKTSSWCCWEGKTCSRHLMWALGLGCHPQRLSSPLAKSWASSNWSNALRSVSFVNESRPCESRMRMLHAQPICRQLGVLHFLLPSISSTSGVSMSIISLALLSILTSMVHILVLFQSQFLVGVDLCWSHCLNNTCKNQKWQNHCQLIEQMGPEQTTISWLTWVGGFGSMC